MATRKLDQSRLMIDAAKSGHDAAESRRNRGERARQFDESTRQRDLDRWQRQWEEKRSNELKKDELDRRYGPKDQGGRDGSIFGGRNVSNFNQDSAAGGPPVDAATQLAQDKLAEEQRQFDIDTQLRAAQSGLQMGGAGGAPQTGNQDIERVAQALEQNPNDQRLQKMLEEMSRGREQMGMGIEAGDRRGRMFVPSPEKRQADAQSRQTERMNAETSRANAIIRERELALRAQQLQAQISGSSGAQSAEFQAQFNKVKKELLNGTAEKPGLNKTINMEKAMENGNATEKQWRRLQEDVAGVDPVGRMATIQEEINNREFGPALRSFLSEKAAKQTVAFVSYTGEFPEGYTPDMSTEGMQTFVKNARISKQFYQSGINAELYPIQNTEQWKRMINRMAGFLTMKKPGQVASGAQGGGGMPMSAAAGDASQGPSHEMRQGTDEQGNPVGAPVKNITPGEAQRRAGQMSDGAYPSRQAGVGPNSFERDRQAMGNW